MKNFEQDPQPSFGEQSPKSEEKPEQELSLEVIEKIMEKVQDINTPGTAYHAIRRASYSVESHALNEKDEKTFTRIFSEGILPLRAVYWRDDYIRAIKKRQASNFTNLNVCFHVIGESLKGSGKDSSSQPYEKYSESDYVHNPDRPFAIIFDKSRLRLSDQDDRYHQKYFPDHPHGFRTPSRIRPEWFRGIVFNDNRKLLAQDVKEDRLNTIIRLMMEGHENHRDRLIPVYGQEGNLLWPRQISYEEVKQFVAEREHKKSEANKSDNHDNPSPE